jgi:rSAM/selenodomain-associated transferase 2
LNERNVVPHTIILPPGRYRPEQALAAGHVKTGRTRTWLGMVATILQVLYDINKKSGCLMPMADQPDVSVVIPVLNEVETINQVIEHLYAKNSGGSFEVIVVDGSPDRNTIKTIHFSDVLKTASERSRAKQMNAGAALARGAVLLFLHADTELPDEAVEKISSTMKAGRYVAGAFDLGIKSDRTIFRAMERIASMRSRLTRIPFGDQAIFVRKDYFHHIGGYKDIPIMEDIELIRRIKSGGKSICILPERVLTSPRRLEKEGILRCTVRNWVLQTLYVLGVSPETLARFYPSP